MKIVNYLGIYLSIPLNKFSSPIKIELKKKRKKRRKRRFWSLQLHDIYSTHSSIHVHACNEVYKLYITDKDEK